MVEQLMQQLRIGMRGLTQGVLASPFVRHVGVLTMANGVGAILSFVQGILVARWLGPELYGVAALVMSVPSLVYTFFDARSAETSVKFLSDFDARGDRARAIALCRLGYLIDSAIAAVAFLGVLVTAPWASRAIVRRPELIWLLIIYAAAFLPRSLQGTSYAVLAVHQRFPTIALIETSVTIVRVAMVLGLVFAGWSVPGVVLGNAIAIALGGLLYALAAGPLIRSSWGGVPWSSTWRALKGYRREFARFLAYNDLNALLGMVSKQLDVVLLGYYRGPQEVGYYRLAKSLVAIVGFLVGPLQTVTYSYLARLWADQHRQEMKRFVHRVAVLVGIPLGGLSLLGILVVPLLIRLLVGEAFTPTVPAAQILLAGSAVWIAFFWLRPLFMARGEVKVWLSISIVVTVLSLAGFAIGTPFWGYIGIAWWLLSMQVLGHGMAIIWVGMHKGR